MRTHKNVNNNTTTSTADALLPRLVGLPSSCQHMANHEEGECIFEHGMERSKEPTRTSTSYGNAMEQDGGDDVSCDRTLVFLYQKGAASARGRWKGAPRRGNAPFWCMTVLLLSCSFLVTPVQAFSSGAMSSSSLSSSLSTVTTLFPFTTRRTRCTTTATTTSLEMTSSDKRENGSSGNGDDSRRKERRLPRRQQARRMSPSSVEEEQAQQHNVTVNGSVNGAAMSPLDAAQRIVQLEELVAKQAVEIARLHEETKSLNQAVDAFASVVEMLRQAGLSTTNADNKSSEDDKTSFKDDKVVPKHQKTFAPIVSSLQDDDEIFGKAPSSVMDAADAAGAAVLASLLAGQRRLLVDVRDAELTNPDVLVQFLELSILPVAAGLEGLRSKRNRLKIVFPKVSQLLEYRKTMALAAPDVVALSTMDFDPIEAQDNLVVILAPHPDDTQGVKAMKALLDPKSGITQPVVVLNPHMAPPPAPAADFMLAYQLRLYTVHYRAKFDDPPASPSDTKDSKNEENNSALEAAMQHAKEVSRNPTEHEGKTRAMVIRAYPNPWNVFLDTSPDTDADFIVAATFEEEPTAEMVQKAVVECLQGSEEEDELVAQQMQQALEAGQLDRVSELLGDMGFDFFDDEDENDEDDDEDDLWRLQDVDTV